MPSESKQVIKKAKMLTLRKKGDLQPPTDGFSDGKLYTSGVGSISLLQTPMSLKSEEENVKNQYIFNSSMKLSDNPFDVFNGSLVQKKVPVEVLAKAAGPKASDSFLLSGLKGSSQVQRPDSRPERRSGIFSQITVISKSNLSIGSKKYYKFPFDISMVNDESSLFNTIKERLMFALSSAYSNFRRFGESFKVVLNDEIFSFSTATTCSLSSEKLLKTNGIRYAVENGGIKIDQADSGLMHDVIMNLEVPRGKHLPFILSPFEFEGGIMFRTKVQKGPVVRSGGTTEYLYTVSGPLDTSDFTFDDCVGVEYN